ncbi:hypothetical protein NUU61_010058 [Penicillium alfredii]|uniref:Zn(2)-C6 fungal-type domain-containing protein n=1 Tax=Penicillium alfredii TaxID=1506179 RepID=A0A9W9JTU3_9EURO|nr:uncharacterized protein NUU61_010058 [Penicillium alfredii]KAJ5081794.1 hypothetical protein NUU61_010058 [Penicillium alfredii]
MPGSKDSVSSRKMAGREAHRSRKGCPECRARKIKCDENRPQCNRCLESGRACRIIDGLFRPHCFTFATPTPSSRVQGSPKTRSARPQPPDQEESSEIWGSPTQSLHLEGDDNASVCGNHSPDRSLVSPIQSRGSIPIGGLLVQTSPSNTFPEAIGTPSAQSLPTVNLHTSPVATQGPSTGNSHTSSHTSAIPACLPEETNQDRAEAGFFLRHFAEGSGQWMDVFTPQRSYFSQYVVQLAAQSPLVRYSACAIAAKQLGQMKDSTHATDNTRRSSLTASALLQSGLDFLWYGAKYYEKAILLLCSQISHLPSSSTHLSPREIYQSSGSDQHQLDDYESTSSALQILSACILCAYEDLSSTMRAWSGHLDGINKLLRPHLNLPITPDNSYRVPQPMRAFEASFWFFALNDMLNGLVLHQPCRLDSDDFTLWHKMGLPLDGTGQLALEYIDELYQETTFFKALIRLLCKLVSHDCGASPHWAHLDEEFTQWYHALPTEFLAPITQTFPPPSTGNPQELSIPETWFGSETCAIAMAFYHMARILLLVNQPQELFLAMQPRKHRDLLSTYNALQRDLHHHAMEIIPIAHGMPNTAVQKYMIQPLYIAGRCLSSSGDRQIVIRLLKHIENDLGLFTEYRVKDLSEEWGVAFESIQEI